MRVLMVNTYHYLRGGDSRYALELSELLRAAGHEVVPFAMQHPESFASEYASYFVPELDYPKLQREGGLRAAWKTASSAVYSRPARKNLRALCGELRPDVAHLHSVMHHLTASVPMELYDQGIPVVWTLHDLKPVCPTTRFLRDSKICEVCAHGRFYNAVRYKCKRDALGPSVIVAVELYLHRLWKVYERADLLIAPSRFLKDKVLASGLRPRRIEAVPNFVDVHHIESRADDDDDYILFVGRLSAEKGVDVLLEASASAGVPVVVAGSGEELPGLQQRCAAENWDQVRFVGHVTGDTLFDMYRGARAIVIPSQWQENCPLVVLEGYACGKPVLGSRLGGLIDLIDHEETGLLVTHDDVQAWSDALRRVWTNAEEARRMGRAARRKAEVEFSPELHQRRILELYEEIGVKVRP